MNRQNLLFDPISSIPPGTASSWGRRDFVKSVAALAGSVGLFDYDMRLAAAEPPPESAKLRVLRYPAACLAPQYVAEDLLRGEGFSELQYVERPDFMKALADGDIDLTLTFTPQAMAAMDDGARLVFLAGIHMGCYDLFGGENVRTVRDLKGKTIVMTSARGATQLFISSLVAFVGLDPAKDINFMIKPPDEARRLFLEGKVDAFMGYPPNGQEFKTKKIGHLLVNSAVDAPWSKHYCCIVTANQEFVRRNPVGTKRALRAILKGTDICAREPERVAKFLVTNGHAANYDYTYQMMTELTYKEWRDYDTEDSVRFWALRLREAGMIKASPQKLIAQNTDWRFLNELKRELKS